MLKQMLDVQEAIFESFEEKKGRKNRPFFSVTVT
jgi:hypothetical protein